MEMAAQDKSRVETSGLRPVIYLYLVAPSGV